MARHTRSGIQQLKDDGTFWSEQFRSCWQDACKTLSSLGTLASTVVCVKRLACAGDPSECDVLPREIHLLGFMNREEGGWCLYYGKGLEYPPWFDVSERDDVTWTPIPDCSVAEQFDAIKCVPALVEAAVTQREAEVAEIEAALGAAREALLLVKCSAAKPC